REELRRADHEDARGAGALLRGRDAFALGAAERALDAALLAHVGVRARGGAVAAGRLDRDAGDVLLALALRLEVRGELQVDRLGRVHRRVRRRARDDLHLRLRLLVRVRD